MAKQQKTWVCDECGRRMTEKQAAAAMKRGCPAGCSGVDVRELDVGIDYNLDRGASDAGRSLTPEH